MKVSDMDKANRLLPCPCGQIPAKEIINGAGQYVYICKNPKCTHESRSFTPEEEWNACAGQPPAQGGVDRSAVVENYIRAFSEYPTYESQHVIHHIQSLEAQNAEANAVIDELVEALEAAIAYIGGNSVVGNQFLDLLEATQSRARAYIGKADS